MILSASRRTDIIAFYLDWFLNRIKEGFVDVRNPMNYHQVSRIDIKPDVVDCIVFWTKNADKILPRINELEEYNYYFQYTINPYDKTIEENVPVKKDIINSFYRLADKVGAEKVIWRYDPILLTDKINVEYHLHYFEELAKRMAGYTERCVISFVDLYKKTIANTLELNMRGPTIDEMCLLAKNIHEIAKSYNIEVASCSEIIDLSKDGIQHGCCIDKSLIEKIAGYRIDVSKDKNQRKECGCVQSIDIGAYNTCCHSCRYCYANFNNQRVQTQSRQHDPLSTLLVGELRNDDVIRERKVSSLKSNNLF